MSVYSGFATRQQENFYHRLTEKVLQLMAERIIKTHSAEYFNEEQWLKYVRKIYKTMLYMEKTKYMPPKISSCLQPIMDYFKIPVTSRQYTLRTLHDNLPINPKNWEEVSVSNIDNPSFIKDDSSFGGGNESENNKSKTMIIPKSNVTISHDEHTRMFHKFRGASKSNRYRTPTRRIMSAAGQKRGQVKQSYSKERRIKEHAFSQKASPPPKNYPQPQLNDYAYPFKITPNHHYENMAILKINSTINGDESNVLKTISNNFQSPVKNNFVVPNPPQYKKINKVFMRKKNMNVEAIMNYAQRIKNMDEIVKEKKRVSSANRTDSHHRRTANFKSKKENQVSHSFDMKDSAKEVIIEKS